MTHLYLILKFTTHCMYWYFKSVCLSFVYCVTARLCVSLNRLSTDLNTRLFVLSYNICSQRSASISHWIQVIIAFGIFIYCSSFEIDAQFNLIPSLCQLIIFDISSDFECNSFISYLLWSLTCLYFIRF